ncbi:MAG: hypothetical protein CL927_04415 [Deltaproteobacteria bacterium]|nr:hypothetical protein [Deltaproteobacteria bacterium]
MTRSVPLFCAVTLFMGACGSSDPGKPSGDGPSGADSAGDSDTGSDVCVPPEPFDVAGCLEIEEFDPNAAGRWPNVERRQFNENGREQSRDTRGGEEPNTERICRTEWDGDRILSEQCSGVSIYRYEYVYSADGFLESSSYDAASDGVLDKIWTYSTDAAGNVLEAAIDDDADGVIDAVQTFAWDADGNQVEETWDYTYDGVVNFRREYIWTEGLLVQELEDSDGDGTNDVEIVYEYDELNRILRVERFEAGSTTAAETSTWTYVGCALDTKVTFDAGGNRVTRSYWTDDLGRVVYEQEDFDTDGTPDRIWATEWICPS